MTKYVLIFWLEAVKLLRVSKKGDFAHFGGVVSPKRKELRLRHSIDLVEIYGHANFYCNRSVNTARRRGGLMQRGG